MKKELFRKNILVSTVRNFKFNSIFIRMLFITLGVFLILCAINFVGIKVLTQQALNNERRNSEFYVDYSYSYLQKLVQKLDEYMYSIEYDSNVVFLRTLPAGSNYAENYSEVANTVSRLRIFRSLVDEVSNVYVYLPNIDRIFTSQGEYEPETFFKLNYLGDYSQWKKLLTQKYMYTFNIWNFDTSPGKLSDLNLVKSFFEGQGSKCVIVANLDRDLVQKLYQGNEYIQNRKIYITDKNLTILSSNITGEAGKQLDLDKATLSKSDKSSYYSNDFLVSYRYLPEDKIYFVVMTPKGIIFSNVNNLTFAAYIVLGIMLVSGLVLSVFLSQQFYLPVGQMLKDMERFATVSMGLPERQNEYDYIKNNINSIYVNNKKLESIIQDSIPFVIDIIIMKLIQGGQETDNAVMLAKQYNIEFKKGYYFSSVLKCTHSYINMTQKAVSELTATIKAGIVSDILSVLKNKDDEIIIITNSESSDIAGLTDRFMQLCARLEDLYEEESFTIGVGSSVDSMYKLNESYSGARKALEERKVQDNNKVFVHADSAVRKENKIHIPASFEERYKNALYAGNLEMSEDLLYEIMDSNYSRNLSFTNYSKMCAWIFGIMERIVDGLDDDMAKNVSKDLLEDIGMSGDIIELHDRLLRNNRLLCTAFMNDKKSDSNLKKILQYIDLNFNKNINLDGVAYNFGYNSSYLSRLFKHIKGVSFSDYLGKKRIEFAKKLLTNQNKTIKEIAEESGYNSTGIFIKAFEKIEGVTPGEFRRKK